MTDALMDKSNGGRRRCQELQEQEKRLSETASKLAEIDPESNARERRDLAGRDSEPKLLCEGS